MPATERAVGARRPGRQWAWGAVAAGLLAAGACSGTGASHVLTAPPASGHPAAAVAPTTRPPPTTTPPTTARPAPQPISAPPRPATTVGAVVGWAATPSTARFPTTPPPYWPMPIENVTVTNTGGVTIRSVVVHPVGVYSVPSSSCSMLQPGQRCVAQVQFCPTSSGHYVNTMLVTGDDAATGAALQTSVVLDGTAT